MGAMASADEEYDYIVVGSGAGGGPVAVNLAKAGFRVLVLEAGGEEEPVAYRVPAFHALSTEHPELAWKFYVQHYADPDRQTRDTRNFLINKEVDGAPRNGIFYPRAGALGGCTAHHAMIFIAPDNSDWDHISELTGDASWRGRRMRKYFRRVERCHYLRRPWWRWFAGAGHGFEGWLPVTIADPALLMRDRVLAQLVLAAVRTCFETRVWNFHGLWRRLRMLTENLADPSDWRQVGILHRLWTWLGSFLDPNDWRRLKQRNEGPAFTPLTIRNGLRVGTRELIRETMRTRPRNLTVKLHALVTRVLLDSDKRAIGVEYLDAPHQYRADPAAPLAGDITAGRRTVKARREVILSGGTFNTPQLLLLSGIGDPKELARHDISVEVALPGVGRNLQDRYEVGIVHQMKDDFEALRNASLVSDAPHFATKGDPNFAEWLNGHGLYATNGAVIAILKRSSHGQPDPDLYLFAIPSHFSGYRPRYSELGAEKDKFTWVLLKGHTRNTAGTVLLHTADPRDPPDINFRYFDEGSDKAQDDLDSVVAGVEFVRRMTARTASLFEERIPGPTVQSRAQLEQFVKDNAWGHHASGTCKIGKDDDPLAVLDGQFRVRGVRNLRVVDASVFPRIPGLFILSAVYMIAEKASDAILARGDQGSWPAAPATADR
jgi:choline dehydrogenase